MKKSILNLVGAQELSKESQKSISGGCVKPTPPPPGYGVCLMANGCHYNIPCNAYCNNGTQPICP
ncbi:hypothetical protein [Moheibacter sediminis]|uniref:Uncharacterized protein n=1 Tax=Moheibacter sediminis TaxID=1434700 RepID=A0A1W2D1C5_9FLAO|nr:hypothetical protein [Moheibacter sediminis]SMC90936.1 hypothetical protein SAMN06296427_11310 [Moheibacter sediminis]